MITTSVDDVAADEETGALYRRLVESRGSESVHGANGQVRAPYALMLLDPTIGAAIEALGSRLRIDSPLPLDVREVAILGAASAANNCTQWAIHLPIARQAEIGVEELSDHLGQTPTFASAIRQAVWRLAHAWTDGDVGEAVDRGVVVERFGAAGLYELVTTVAYYRMLATQLAVFES